MLVLFLCAVIGEVLQPGVITQAPTALLAQTDRTYKAAPTNLLGQVMVSLFRIGTIGMAMCLCLYEGGSMRFTTFLVLCGLVIAVVLVKMLVNLWVDYTFMLSRRYPSAYEHYGNIVTLTVSVLYPALLVALHMGSVAVGQWSTAVAACGLIAMWLYRSARMVVSSIPALVYLLLYVATTDGLPMVMLVYLSKQTLLYL